MQTIDYKVTRHNPKSFSSNINNILTNDKTKFWEVHSDSATICISFDKSQIDEVSLNFAHPTRFTIEVYNDQNESDTRFLLEKEETNLNLKYSVNADFPAFKGTEFKYARLHMTTSDLSGNLKIYHWIMRSNRDKAPTVSKINQPKLNTIQFYMPANNNKNPVHRPVSQLSTPRKKSIEQVLPKQNIIQTKLSGKILTKSIQNVELEEEKYENFGASMDNPDFIEEQQKILNDIRNKKQRTLRSFTSTHKKEPTNSYKNILQNCIISCAVHDPNLMIGISDLCETLGACFIEDLDESVTHFISDGSNNFLTERAKELNVSVVEID